MYMRLITWLLILSCLQANGQVTRNFFYKGRPIRLLAQNNRMENNFGYPGMQMFLIIGDRDTSLDSIYETDQLRQMPITGLRDYACFYYLQYNNFLKDSAVAFFLTDFIDYCYNEDYIDRNRVHIVWSTGKDTIPCKLFNKPYNLVSSVSVLPENTPASCDTISITPATAQGIWETSHTAKTSISYQVPGLLEMEEKEKDKKMKIAVADYKKRKGSIFFQFTGGTHHIGNQYKTAFDTTTLVDFTRFKTLWNLNAGYYFTNCFFSNIDFAFIYSGKQKNIDGIDWGNGNGVSIRGSGYAGAILRYGVGIGWLPYNKNRLNILLNIEAGRLKAIAGGGVATRIIGGGGSGAGSTSIVKENEKSIYYNLKTGIQYRLGNSAYFTSNFQYTISSFKQPIGSVSAFTGWSYNLGIGFIIPTKKL